MNHDIAKLTAQVNGTNRVNRRANKLYDELKAIFEPFVGQKVKTAAGLWTAKVSKALSAFPPNNVDGVHVYANSSDYSLAYSLSVSEPIGDSHIHEYSKTTVYIGILANNVLTELHPKNTLREDYTVDEIKAKREVLDAAEKAVDAAKSALYPFEKR